MLIIHIFLKVSDTTQSKNITNHLIKKSFLIHKNAEAWMTSAALLCDVCHGLLVSYFVHSQRPIRRRQEEEAERESKHRAEPGAAG